MIKRTPPRIVMLLDSSTGLDLNNAGTTLLGIDILWDVPGVVSIGRLRYAEGTRLEISTCPANIDVADIDTFRGMIPNCSVPLRGYESNTLGCGHGDEWTVAYWTFDR